MEKFADYFGSLTLYDLFAYLLPGLPTLLGSLILGWTVFAPKSVLNVQTPSGYIVASALVIAYVLGHFMQALGNQLDKVGRQPLPGSVPKRLEEKVRQELGLGNRALKSGELQMHARDLVFRKFDYKPPTLRDIFEYRLGYYRGMTLALCIFGVSIVARMLIGTAQIKSGNRVLSVSDVLSLTVVLTVVVVTWAHYMRFRRFQFLLDRFDALALL
jgi:hypothetical protein